MRRRDSYIFFKERRWTDFKLQFTIKRFWPHKNSDQMFWVFLISVSACVLSVCDVESQNNTHINKRWQQCSSCWELRTRVSSHPNIYWFSSVPLKLYKYGVTSSVSVTDITNQHLSGKSWLQSSVAELSYWFVCQIICSLGTEDIKHSGK